MPLEVLIVDDNEAESTCELLIDKFPDHIRCKSVLTGNEALEELQRHKYDLVILDYDLEEESGADVGREIRRKYKEDIYLIGYSVSWTYEKAFKATLDTYVSNRYELADFVTTMLEEP